MESTIIECCHCGKKAEVQSITLWTEWFSNLPQGWLVTDVYPSEGDGGLRFACSIYCSLTFVKEHVQ